MDQLDGIFKMMYYSICDIAKWIFAIKMASDIIKDGNNSDIQGVIKSVIHGGLSYGCLYAIVNVLDAVQSKFQ